MGNNFRPDFTNALIHLTQSRTGKTPFHAPGRMFDDEGANSKISAFEVLKEIINTSPTTIQISVLTIAYDV